MTASNPLQWRAHRRKSALFALAAATVIASVEVIGAVAGRDSEIGFTAKQADVPVDGVFKSFVADVNFDPAKPEAGKVDLTIDVASVATSSQDADDLLRGKDLFDVATYPRATFKSLAIRAVGPGRFEAQGQLTLKGRSGAVTVPFAARAENHRLYLTGGLPVSRLAYGVGAGEWSDTGTLADQVTIRFKLNLPE